MRPFLIWRDDWMLGFEALDDQHLELADTLNELHRFIAREGEQAFAGMERLCGQLSNLLEMTRRHFQDEEALMQAEAFPGLTAHHREHALLLAELQECVREIESGSKPFTLATLTALKYWQIDHVLNSDRVFVDYLRRRSGAFRDLPLYAKTPGSGGLSAFSRT